MFVLVQSFRFIIEDFDLVGLGQEFDVGILNKNLE